MSNKSDFQFKKAMEQLEEINQWFQEEDIDLEEGLNKLRQGKDLIVACRQRLAEVENEFISIKKEFEESSELED